MGLAVERGHADHGRIRAWLDRRRERLCRAQGDELPARARRAASPVRPAALAAAAAEQWRRGIGRSGGGATGDAGPVGSGGRRRRTQGLRRAGREGQPDLDGDRRHELRRDGDGAGRRAGHRRTDDRRLSSHDAVGGDPYRRRGRRHDRLGRRCRAPPCRPAGRRRSPRSRSLWTGRRESDRHRRATRAGPPASRPAGRRRGHARRRACTQSDRDQARQASRPFGRGSRGRCHPPA